MQRNRGGYGDVMQQGYHAGEQDTGHPAAGWSHLARTVARRAERHLTALWRAEGAAPGAAGYPQVRIYLNRLSDFFFVLARAVNQAAGVPETPWRP